MSAVNPIADRRQRAREAGQDEFGGSYGGVLPDAATAIDAAIEVATQVKITPDIVRAFADAYGVNALAAGTTESLIAAFRAAGFEVVE